jgi:hypothetical protein
MPAVSVVYDNACETCDAKGPSDPIVSLDGEDGRTFICAECAKMAVAVLRALGLTS